MKLKCPPICICVKCLAKDLPVTGDMLDEYKEKSQLNKDSKKALKEAQLTNENCNRIIKEQEQYKKYQDEIQMNILNQYSELEKMQDMFSKKLSKDTKLKQIATLRLDKIKLQEELGDVKQELLDIRGQVREEVHKRNSLHECWKSAVEEVLIEHHEKVKQMEIENKLLKRQNEAYKASAKQAAEILEDDVSKITSLKSELKLKNDQKQNLIQQKRDFEAKIRALDTELKESKVDECPICFEETSIERKWTAFLPCGHRTCSECADKISALPRNTNRRKCPNCRENINCFLVLEGIYED